MVDRAAAGRGRWLAVLAFAGLLFGCGELDEAALRELGAIVLPEPIEIAAFSLTDHEGSEFTGGRFTGGWTLVFFGYTHCPDICPVTLATLSQTASQLTRNDDELRAGLRILLVSVDPERDTPAVLNRYVSSFAANVTGVTGAAADLAAVAESFYASFQKARAPASGVGYLVDHSANVGLVNPSGDLHGFFKPPFDAESMATALAAIDSTFFQAATSPPG